jgi:CRISPR system Cascade subunit CasD
MTPNTLFLRLEGPLQAWGDNSKFVVRRSMEAPTKSGVLGLVCCAMGLSRWEARERLPQLNTLAMGVRIDRPGMRWWDYHTVGARIGLTTAGGGLKTGAQGTLITRREYLADASFLVALHGEAAIIEDVATVIESPKWPVFLGRKSCPPSRPIFEGVAQCEGLSAALRHPPWRPRYEGDEQPTNEGVPCLVEWRPAHDGEIAPDNAEVWYDAPFSFDPPAHHPRFVVRVTVAVQLDGPLQRRMPSPPRPRADYNNSEYKKRRGVRLDFDHYLCVFCKSFATTVQHITYRRAGGDETQEDLRSLCRLCHDAVTMIEYGLGMGLDRINPEDPRWRKGIIEKREEIIRFRSLERRRRVLRSAPDDVRREMLEQD